MSTKLVNFHDCLYKIYDCDAEGCQECIRIIYPNEFMDKSVQDKRDEGWIVNDDCVVCPKHSGKVAPMSRTIFWAPKIIAKDIVPYKLAEILNKRYVSLNGLNLSEKDLEWLQGIMDAGVEEAGLLIDAIKSHKNILLSEEY